MDEDLPNFLQVDLDDVRKLEMSYFGTSVLSLGVTPELSTFGKVLVAAVMFFGWVGPLTFMVFLALRQQPPRYKLPEESIAIG